MPDAYVIEVSGRTAGIVARDSQNNLRKVLPHGWIERRDFLGFADRRSINFLPERSITPGPISRPVDRRFGDFSRGIASTSALRKSRNAKLEDLRDAAADNALFAKVSAALKKLGEINPHRPAPSSAPAPSDQTKNRLTEGQESERPIPVEVHQPEPGPFAIVQTIAGTALSPLETTFIVVVFVIFILLQREDLRNRFIRLAGSSEICGGRRRWAA